MGSGSLSRKQSGLRGSVDLAPPHAVPRLKKEQSFTSTTHLELHGMFWVKRFTAYRRWVVIIL